MAKSNESFYRKLYSQIEFQATQTVRNTTMGQRGKEVGDGYFDAVSMMMCGNVFKSVDKTMRTMGATAKFCKDAVVGMVNSEQVEKNNITEVMCALVYKELGNKGNWTMLRKKPSGNIGWLCKPKFGATVPIGLTETAKGTDYYFYFENRVAVVNVKELSFNFEAVDNNLNELQITLPYLAGKMGISSLEAYKREVRNKVMPWIKVTIKPEAEMMGIYNYAAFYVYPRCVGMLRNIKGYVACRNSAKVYNNGAFLLLPAQYYENNCFDVRAMRVITPGEYVSMFYKGDFEWCLVNVQPSFSPLEIPRRADLAAMVR